jgi:branched-chain amino acid transport system substrate-binding protein
MTATRRMAKLSALLLASALGASAALAQEVGVSKDTVKIGGMGPLTGPLANLVAPAMNAIEAVFEEANAAGGVHGRKVVYIKEDDKCQPSEGVGAVKKLIHEVQPFMILGGGCSNAAIAQKPEIQAAKIPWVIVASTADSLTEPPDPYIFSSMSAAWMEVYGALQHLLDQGKKNIGVVWQGDAWGKARIEPMRQALKGKGLEAVAVEEVAIEPTDLTPVVLKMQQAKADGVVLLLFPKAAVPYLRDAYKFGFQPLTTGGSPLAEIDVIAKGVGDPKAVANFRAVSPAGYGVDDPQVAKWKAVIEKRFPNDRFNVVHMFGIAAAQFTLEALRQTGPNLTREKFVKTLSTLTMQPDTYAGPVKCTPEDHQCHRVLGLFALKDGRVTGIGKAAPTR